MKNETMRPNPGTPEALVNELRAIAIEAEKLLGASFADCAKESTDSLRTRLAEAQGRFTELCKNAGEKVREGTKAADRTVRSHPYEAIALAMGVGALVGALLHRGPGNPEEKGGRNP